MGSSNNLCCPSNHSYRGSNYLCRSSNDGIHRCTNHHHTFNIFANCTLHAHLCTCLYTCLNTCPCTCPCPCPCREEACYEEEGQEKRMLQVSEHNVLCGPLGLQASSLMSSTSGANVSQSFDLSKATSQWIPSSFV